jgi:polyisoprenoid-binding protein YceI
MLINFPDLDSGQRLVSYGFVHLHESCRVGSSAPGQPQSFTATGELMLHGVTKTVTVTLDTVLTGHGGQVTGRIPITFSDFGVQAPNIEFVTVEGTGSVEFLLNLTQK